jgi:hypothetical protein
LNPLASVATLASVAHGAKVETTAAWVQLSDAAGGVIASLAAATRGVPHPDTTSSPSIRRTPEPPAPAFAAKVSPGEAKIFLRAAALAGKGATFMQDVFALEKVVKRANSTNQVWKLGEVSGKPVYGRIGTGVGIVEIAGATKVVRVRPGEHYLVLQDILGSLHQ